MSYTYVMSKAEMVSSRGCLHVSLSRSTVMEVTREGHGYLHIANSHELDDWLDDDEDSPDATYSIEFFRECSDAHYF